MPKGCSCWRASPRPATTWGAPTAGPGTWATGFSCPAGAIHCRCATVPPSYCFSSISAIRRTISSSGGTAGRGWARRLASPSDRKAVFVAATDEGACKQKVIARTVDALARTQLWARLDDDRRRALARTWRVVIADVQARKELDRKAALELLQPIE